MEKGKVDMELIRRYIRGELSPREMYALERQAQADPMLMDIILGMEQEALGAHDDNLADIRKRIAERTGRQQTVVRRLVPAQRWAIAASLLAVLTVGAWWFMREDTVEQQREATVAAIPEGVPQAVPEAGPSPGPAPSTDDREAEADAASQRAPNAPSAAAVAEKKEKKEVRLASITPKADTDADLLDSAVVVGYGTQQKSDVTGAAARIAAAEMDTSVSANEQLLAGRTDGIHIRGISAHKLAARSSVTEQEIAENPNDPSPKEGWGAYRKYLMAAVKLAPGQGIVDLTFTVDDDGRPTDIMVIETTNEDLNTFATLIVRDGPHWLPGANGDRKVNLRIEFK